MDIQMIKSEGKAAFKANYWRCVLVAFIMGLLGMGSSSAAGRNTSGITGTEDASGTQGLTEAIDALSPEQQSLFLAIIIGSAAVVIIVGVLLRIFLFNPIQVGAYRFFKTNIREGSARAGILTEGFGGYGRTFVTLFLRDLFIALWSLLFVIPGLVKSYSYMLVPYLIKDHPELSATETITRSKEMMNGHKWEAFVMTISFIGWFILGAVTFNLVNIFWTNPYLENARARFYLELSGEATGPVMQSYQENIYE